MQTQGIKTREQKCKYIFVASFCHTINFLVPLLFELIAGCLCVMTCLSGCQVNGYELVLSALRD